MTLGGIILIGLVIAEIPIFSKLREHSKQLKEHSKRINQIEELTKKPAEKK